MGLPEGKCDQFSLTLGAEEVPEVLRRVATVIERIDGFRLLDLTMTLCEEEATASVYYWKEAKPSEVSNVVVIGDGQEVRNGSPADPGLGDQ